MSSPHEDETTLIDQICAEIRPKHTLEKKSSQRLEKCFGERFKKAISLVERGAVKRYAFKPSGRIIWEVQGKSAVYQVLSHINFCNCDDYYFRVMNSKKQNCYHIIAQRIACALDKFEREEHSDDDYGKITRKWKKSLR